MNRRTGASGENRAGTIFDARGLVVEYHSRGVRNRALDGVSITIAPGEAVGLIGESGSGKSTLARVLLGLKKPTAGQVLYVGTDIYSMRGVARFRLLGRNTAMVFQDPRSSLNPRMTVAAVVADPFRVYRLGSRVEQAVMVEALLEDVGLPPQLAKRNVRTLSGGQLQRVALARALAMEPQVIVADEPTSALDVSVQAQILNLLKEIRERRNLALLVVSHDMRVIRFLTDRTMVMRGGRLVESGTTESLYEDPQESYTNELLAAAPLLTRA